MKSVAIVTPWFGEDLKGGAERQAYQVAARLAARGHSVEVLTTCCRAFEEDWGANHFPTGTHPEGGIIVRRFVVDQRNKTKFDRINDELLSLPSVNLRPGVDLLPHAATSVFVDENINSDSLINHLREHHARYHAFIFIPYLYGPILRGLPVVARKAFLQPCLHDEAYAYLPEVEKLFRLARGLIFNSEGEAQLAAKLYGPGVLSRSTLVGEGIELLPFEDEQLDQALSSKVKGERFVLYLGRRCATKNVDLLTEAYAHFKARFPQSKLSLVLAGSGQTDFTGEGITDLGWVSEDEKAALLRHCLTLFQPSRNESYSRVQMEAWTMGRPVAVHRECMATATAVERAGGGWTASTIAEWIDVFAEVDSLGQHEMDRIGERGRAYAAEHADWDASIDRYEEALDLPTKNEAAENVSPSFERRKPSFDAVHQLLPDLAYGDAISNQAIAIRNHLRALGYRSEIFVKNLDRRVSSEAKFFDQDLISKDAGLFYHHSIGSELTKFAIEHRGPRCLIYHNITPAKFFAPYRPGFAWMLEAGRADLGRLAPQFALSVGDSAYNAAELAACNFQNPGVLPIIVDPAKWNMVADPRLMDTLQDGKANLLFAGRIAPNKCQDQLLEAFASYLTLDPNARLIIVGDGRMADPYYRRVVDLVKKFDLENQVVIAGQVGDAQLSAYYRTAHLYWSMSEHEGFCVPIVEAMWFDTPVLAYRSSAVPETLGEAGVMFTSKTDLREVAELAKLIIHDGDLRKRVLAAQRKRRMDFLPNTVLQVLEKLLQQMSEQTKFDAIACV
ncbi:MAG: glycosyltransferase [Pyrinomonadaceae bacterium]|nr:glycosyltransferase [Pyrinomonadaceae bacterium]